MVDQDVEPLYILQAFCANLHLIYDALILIVGSWSYIQEALRDLNEELEENHIQTEQDLREELDMASNRTREVGGSCILKTIIMFWFREF